MAATPIVLVSGYLGSGKTALLDAWLARPDWADTAVIVNEVGEAPLDHGLLRHGSETLEAISAGCLCCGVRGQLLETLHRLLVQRARGAVANFQRIVIETSGLADPAALAAALMADGFLAEATRIERLICALDALAGPDRLAEAPEAARQLAVADSIVVTKGDLADADQRAAAESAARAANPAAALAHSPPAERAGEVALAPLATGAVPRVTRDDAAAAGHAHGDTVTLTRRAAAPLPRARVEVLMRAAVGLGADLLRFKAALPVAEHPGRVAVLQASGHRPLPPRWLAATDLPEESRGAVVLVCRASARGRAEALLADSLTVESEIAP